MKTPAKRLLVVAALVAAAMPSTLPTTAGPRAQLVAPVQACSSPTQTKFLVAKEMGNGKIGYGTPTRPPRIPGPTITIDEGTCLQVDLENRTSRPVSIHTHGVKYTFESDGTPHNKGCVAPGQSASYVFNATVPEVAGGFASPGTAGYWHYHDHCRTLHGTDGIRRGLYGALIVRRPGDPVPDGKPHVLVMNDLTFNNRTAPNTPIIYANLGERVEFEVIGHGEQFHTFHLHGHSWFDNRTGLATPLEAETTQVIDNKPVGPADSFGFQVVAGQGGVGPGAWMYHCHVQGHSDAGMAGLFVVRTAGGELTDQTKAAIKRWKEQHGGAHHG